MTNIYKLVCRVIVLYPALLIIALILSILVISIGFREWVRDSSNKSLISHINEIGVTFYDVFIAEVR